MSQSGGNASIHSIVCTPISTPQRLNGPESWTRSFTSDAAPIDRKSGPRLYPTAPASITTQVGGIRVPAPSKMLRMMRPRFGEFKTLGARAYTRPVDPFALEALEFPAIRQRVASAAATDPGAALAGALTPSADAQEVARRQALT